MARIKRGVVSHAKHKKIFKLTKGFKGTRGRLIRNAKEALLHSGSYAYRGRKLRKQDFRTLWITRIGEASKQEGISYSRLMNNLKKANIELDRKILCDLINTDMETFKKVVDKVKTVN